MRGALRPDGGILALLLSAWALSAPAAVTVEFVQPEKYADVGRYQRADRDAVLEDLRAHLVKLGQTLPANHHLAIEVLDIDLAGDERILDNATDVRIQRGGADWPSMRLRYTLERDGRKESHEVRLSDMNYQQRARPAAPTESLPHEKRMLTDWFNSLKLSTKAK